MKHISLLPLATALLLTAITSSTDALAAKAPETPQRQAYRFQRAEPRAELRSLGSSLAAKAAAADTFYLFGGPDEPTEGKFQDFTGTVPDRQGWTGIDHTDLPVYWQVSTRNAENLNDNGPGNHAAWCGRTAEQEPGWAAAPGYGNSWDQSLLWVGQVGDPEVGQAVALDFFFNHDTEPGYDFFEVLYDSGGVEKLVLREDSSNEDPNDDFLPPGARFSETDAASIVYDGGDYAGEDGDQIRIVLRVRSDGAWSDEDGLFPTNGAAYVDDITVTWSDGTSFEDFESGFQEWKPFKKPFAGDFSEAMRWVSDIDPCHRHTSPVMAFVDDGDSVGNSSSTQWLPGYPVQTDGALSANWSYGVPGGWVINHSNGLTSDAPGVDNSVWSPVIEWDLDPNVTDASDDPDVDGVILGFDWWAHLPKDNGIYFTIQVRVSPDAVWWTDWRDAGMVHHWDEEPTWNHLEVDISDRMSMNYFDYEYAQFALRVMDLSDEFAVPGLDATPSPVFDNVSLRKYRLEGPALTARLIDLAHDSFAPVSTMDVSTPAGRDALDVPFDMTNDILESGGLGILTGDSIVATAEALVRGTGVEEFTAVWILDKNPFFEDAIRSVPDRAEDRNVITGPTQWQGEVIMQESDPYGWTFDQSFFDLPDADFLYPGDVLRYYFEAVDNEGRVTTLPRDVSGFASGEGYDRRFTVRALPTITAADRSQPPILVWSTSGHDDTEAALHGALAQTGLVEGVDYDTYTSLGVENGVSDGLGSAGGHGASAELLSGYHTILHLSGDLGSPDGSGVLSDGSGSAPNDKSDDLGVLTEWFGQNADRRILHFGDGLFTDLAASSPAGLTYLNDLLGVDAISDDVRDVLGGLTAPTVQPLSVDFTEEIVAFGGCPGINRFDHIRAREGAIRGHGFVGAGGAPVPDVAASVLRSETTGDGAYRKVAASFPFGLRFVRSPVLKSQVALSSRARLLEELLAYAGVETGGTPTSSPPLMPLRMTVHPNPFNPTTTIRFSNLPVGTEGSVRIFNVRGERVRVVVQGPLTQDTYVWDGTDAHGARVATGVYFVEGRAGDYREVIKVALVE